MGNQLIPEATQFPDWYLDRAMPLLTGAEWKVLSYIIRHTLCFGANDVFVINEGRMARGCGVSEEGVREALNVLLDKTTLLTNDQSGCGLTAFPKYNFPTTPQR